MANASQRLSESVAEWLPRPFCLHVARQRRPALLTKQYNADLAVPYEIPASYGKQDVDFPKIGGTHLQNSPESGLTLRARCAGAGFEARRSISDQFPGIEQGR